MGEDKDQEKYPRPFPAKVAAVIDHYTIVINRGKKDEVARGQTFIVYKPTSREITDPETGEKLGKYEHYLGSGEIIFVEENWATLQSNMKTESQSSMDFMLGIMPPEWNEWNKKGKLRPFDYPREGDYVKRTY